MLEALPGTPSAVTPMCLTPVSLTPRSECLEENEEAKKKKGSQLMEKLKLLSESTAKRIEDTGILNAARKARESIVDRWQREVKGSKSVYLESGVEQTTGPMQEEEFIELCGGGEVLQVPRRTNYTQTVRLSPGQLLRWQFYAHTEIHFSLRQRTMSHGGAIELDLIDSQHALHRAGFAVVGHYAATSDNCQLVACFDNTRSLFRSASMLFSFSTANATIHHAEAPVLPVPPSLRPPCLEINQNKVSLHDQDNTNIPLIQLNKLCLTQIDDTNEDEDDDDDRFALVPSSARNNQKNLPDQHTKTAASNSLDGVDIADVISL